MIEFVDQKALSRMRANPFESSPGSLRHVAAQVDLVGGPVASHIIVQIEDSPQLPLLDQRHEEGRAGLERGKGIPAAFGSRIRERILDDDGASSYPLLAQTGAERDEGMSLRNIPYVACVPIGKNSQDRAGIIDFAVSEARDAQVATRGLRHGRQDLAGTDEIADSVAQGEQEALAHLAFLTRRDIEVDDHGPERPSLLVRKRLRAHQEPSQPPVRIHDPILGGQRLQGPQEVLDLLLHPVPIVRMERGQPSCEEIRFILTRRQAYHSDHLRRPSDPARPVVPIPDAETCNVLGHLQALLPLAQRAQDPLALSLAETELGGHVVENDPELPDRDGRIHRDENRFAGRVTGSLEDNGCQSPAGAPADC